MSIFDVEFRLMDQFLKAPGTPAEELYFEPRLNLYRALLAADVGLDKARWASWGQAQTFNQALDLIANSYLPGRRTHLFTNHTALRPAYPNNAGIPAAQGSSPGFRFGAMEANPPSANQAEEYFQVLNPNPFAVDLSGWSVAGAVQFSFKPGTVVPAGDALHVAKNVQVFRERTSSPKGGEGLFVQGNYQGQLSARGEALELRDASRRLLTSTNYAGNPSAAQQWLRITELMCHPAAEECEFIELKSIGPVPLDLAGVRLADGVDFSFTGSAVTALAPGARVLVVKDLAAFAARYDTNGLLIAGMYAGALDNAGERLRLLDASGEEILDFIYDNRWYPITDGFGFLLVIADDAAPFDSWDQKASWRPSGRLGGTPGANDPGLPAIALIVINEALSRTDLPPPTDSIELFNPATHAVDLGGWFLTDDFHTPKKFRIPNGTVIPAGGFVVFDEAQFNPAPGQPPSFALGSDGDEVWLFSGDAATNLTGYFHEFAFGAAENGVSFGRYLNSAGEEQFVAQAALTLGQPNAGPRVGPVVVSEIMFHPPDTGGASFISLWEAQGFVAPTDPAAENLEFIELHNPTLNAVPLFDPAHPTNTWRLREAVDFEFPAHLTLGPGGFLLVVGFDPKTDLASLAAVRTR